MVCSAMLLETIQYYIKKSYALFLDASNAFDRLNHLKLFKIQLNRKVCPLIIKLKLNN